MQYYQYSYTDVDGVQRVQVNVDGFGPMLSARGATQIEQTPMTDKDDEPLPLLTILESNGLDDALWCLRAASLDRLSRHFQAWCADQVLHLFEAKHPNDKRVRDQIAMLRNDDASPLDRAAARAAAGDAARAAVRAAAWAAARAAAWAAQEKQLHAMLAEEMPK